MAMTNKEVAHAYATGATHKSVRNGSGSLYVHGPTIYSYGNHWPIAARVPGYRDTYLLNTDRYSMTTAHHRSLIAGKLAMAGATLIDVDCATIRQATEHGVYPELPSPAYE